jgi:hypothetical protein
VGSDTVRDAADDGPSALIPETEVSRWPDRIAAAGTVTQLKPATFPFRNSVASSHRRRYQFERIETRPGTARGCRETEPAYKVSSQDSPLFHRQQHTQQRAQQSQQSNLLMPMVTLIRRPFLSLPEPLTNTPLTPLTLTVKQAVSSPRHCNFHFLFATVTCALQPIQSASEFRLRLGSEFRLHLPMDICWDERQRRRFLLPSRRSSLSKMKSIELCRRQRNRRRSERT